MALASAASTTNGRATRRRPSRSEAGPATIRAGSRPAAYTAKMSVSSVALSPSRSRYTSSSGVEVFVP